MNCAVCGADNLPTARFCDRCGSALDAQAPATGATVSLNRDAGESPGRAEHHARVYESPSAPPRQPTASASPARSWTPPAPSPAPAPYVSSYNVGTLPQQSSSALLSLILGIVSVSLFVVLLCTLFLSPFTIALGIPAVFLGRRAQREIALSNGRLTGAGMARAGTILGWINIALSLVGFVALCSIPLLAVLGSQG
jgi:hypothetical protein